MRLIISICVVNGVFLLTGILLISAGISISNTNSEYNELVTNQSYIPGMVTATGVFIILSSVIGFYVAYSKNFYFAAGFVVLMIIVLVLEIAIVIAAPGSMSDAKTTQITSIVREKLKDYHGNAEIAELWDELQMELECCGVYGPKDYEATYDSYFIPRDYEPSYELDAILRYYGSSDEDPSDDDATPSDDDPTPSDDDPTPSDPPPTYVTLLRIPVSCCNLDYGTFSPFNCTKSNAHATGCEEALRDLLSFNIVVTAFWAAVALFIQIFLTAMSGWLAWKIKIEKHELAGIPTGNEQAGAIDHSHNKTDIPEEKSELPTS